MKKSYLLFVVTSQIIYSCASPDNTENYNYQEKFSERTFTHLDKEQPKLTSNKRISPSEESYPGINSSKKYFLKSPEIPKSTKANQVDIEIPDIKSSIVEKPNDDDDDDDQVFSGSLDSENPDIEENKAENKKQGGYYKVGTPYKIAGITYYPEKYDNFEEVGLASWYGAEFDGKATANGEIYHMQDFTAAHRTLPLPSMVKVTNLSNGKSVVVRVNDRGPFASNRVIDVSERAAEKLGFKGRGTTTVKVQFLKDETRALLVKISKEKNEQLQK
jgi:rare lipoprotein A (peptidoglycan hydrolase)